MKRGLLALCTPLRQAAARWASLAYRVQGEKQAEFIREHEAEEAATERHRKSPAAVEGESDAGRQELQSLSGDIVSFFIAVKK